MITTISGKLATILGTGALCLVSAAGLAQGVPDITSAEALGHLGADDRALIQDAVSQALNDTRNTTTKRWRNQASGAAGRAQVATTFRTRDARSCKLLRIAAPGVEGNLSYTFCRDEAGNWQEAIDVRPPRQRS